MYLYKKFKAEIAHYLPNVAEGHPCKRLHGHSIEITIGIVGEQDTKLGWVVDTQWMKRQFEPIYQSLDHHLLNEIPGLENPTAENVACWIWEKAATLFPGLYSVQVSETATSGVIYYGPNTSVPGTN